MKFTMNRDRVVASTSGHVIGFKKGEPTYVPPEARKDVLEAGGSPEDDEYDPDPKKPEGPKVPVDPTERRKAVFAVFERLVLRNKREDFTGNNIPSNKVMKTELGWELPAAECGVLWTEFNKKGA